GEDIDQGRLAGAVRPDQPEQVAAPEREGDLAQGDETAKADRDAMGGELAHETRPPPPPWWGRASPLSELASLEAKGEGVTLAAAFGTGVLPARVTPSPRFSNLATLAKRNGPPPPTVPPRGTGR